MKLGITLLIRDEIDIVRQWMDFHLPLADILVITDNGSVDGTREILANYASSNPDKIIIIDEPGRTYQQNVWVDRMIKICLEHNPDWIMNSDADEFWHVPLKKLDNAPANIGAYCIRHRNMVPTILDDFDEPCPIKRMKWWVATPRTKWEWWCMRSWNKVIHRADGWKANALGNHTVIMDEKYKIINAPREWRIDHYSNRSWPQFRRKYINGGEAYTMSNWDKRYGFHWRERYEIYAGINGNITRLKRKWFEEIETDLSKLEPIKNKGIVDTIIPQDFRASDNNKKTAKQTMLNSSTPNHFFIVTACHNPGAALRECVQSVFSQTYNGWQMVIIDDVSDDDSTKFLKDYDDNRIKLIRNAERKYALRNIVESIERYSAHDSIVVILDGDDKLSDENVLQSLNSEYQQTDYDCIWTRYVNQDGQEGISKSLNGQDPLRTNWCCGHLRTFRKRLMWGISKKLFKNDNGDWWTRAYDQALYRPIVKVANKRHFFNRVCMVHNESDNNDIHAKQNIVPKIHQQLIRDFNYSPKNILFFVSGFTANAECSKQPLDVTAFVTRLRARKHKIKIVDRLAQPGVWLCAREIRQSDIFCVYIDNPHWPDGERILKKLQRQRNGKYIIAVGQYAILNPDKVWKYVDHVGTDDADFDIAECVEQRLNGIANPKQ